MNSKVKERKERIFHGYSPISDLPIASERPESVSGDYWRSGPLKQGCVHQRGFSHRTLWPHEQHLRFNFARTSVSLTENSSPVAD